MATKTPEQAAEESPEITDTPAASLPDPEVSTQQVRRARARRAIEDLQDKKRLKGNLESEEYLFD